ncbi:MAG: ceramidase domain-containing protein, partial [Paracoccaceae bacterium]
MNWTEAIDSYCERLGPDLWAEPLNAITNLAFILAGVVMWRRSYGFGRVLSVIVICIGIGSGLFHTFAQAWAGLADVLPILIFILAYVFAANRDMWGLGPVAAFCVMLLFFPYAAVTLPLFATFDWLGSTAGYAPVPLLILGYAAALYGRAPETARGLTIGVGILLVSMAARTVDTPLCAVVPFGTHFLWHILNAAMLAWMIEVWTRHTLATRAV